MHIGVGIGLHLVVSVFEVCIKVHAIVVVRVGRCVCFIMFFPRRQAERVCFRICRHIEVIVVFGEVGQSR